MNHVPVNLIMKLTRKLFVPSLVSLSFAFLIAKAAWAETATVHSNVVWEMTDVVVKGNMILHWRVEKDDLWSFNPQLFPEGHTADGIPVNALKDYIYPGIPIGMLIGKIGDCGRIFPMGTSGSMLIIPDEDGEFLYLTMNDDIIGLYGKGFTDNEGEIIVKMNQKAKE